VDTNILQNLPNKFGGYVHLDMSNFQNFGISRLLSISLLNCIKKGKAINTWIKLPILTKGWIF